MSCSTSGACSMTGAPSSPPRGRPEDAYDGIVTSGEACWQLFQRRELPPFDRLGPRCLLVTRGGDRSVVEGLALSLTEDVRSADFILLAGLDDALAKPEIWRQPWSDAIARGLPMICAN